MGIYYCTKWSNIKKKPWKIIDENTARVCHQKHEPYTAVLTEDEKTKYTVNVTDKWVSVSFYDDFIREYLNYSFEVMNSGKIFLRTATYWEYDEEGTDKEISSLILGFRDDGYIAMEKRDFKTGLVEERETTDTIESNWDVFPDFGQYLYLCKEER